ncbi:uncharacterized protein LOC112167386 isoform X1 [Rosa chinensis]|uniref:uncharacterized protein LOC112167386 isoform X1 n=1 Tax=Rosa chinensis TaxID=74649 RepID=UPI000D0970A6|nr:uncharacterized protein LOC112167386 isoform X1 [Rosa chinensis]
MGDKATLAKARKELEDMYEGIPDDSVNLTFQDFADLSISTTADKRKPTHTLESISEFKSQNPMARLPSLDFNRALQASKNNHRINEDVVDPYRGNHHNLHHQNNHYHLDANSHRGHAGQGGHRYGGGDHHGDDQGHNFNHHMMSGHGGVEMSSISMATSTTYDHHDVSGVSMASTAVHQQDRGGRRRPGVPHSNICTICSTYIYIFRHRCLVCGRVYCRQCVMVGMGEMTEGRKCVQCLGRRFSQRYIQKAGKVGCCSRYPSAVKQAELKWAEKGPRRYGGNGPYGHSTMGTPRSKSPVTPRTPRTPIRAHAPPSPGPNSFVTSSSYSPYSPSHHHLPF